MATKRKISRIESIKKTLSLIASLDGISSSNKDWRGFKAEEKALKAARYWERKKIIRGVRSSKRLGPEDMARKDLTLILLNGGEAPVQVKNYCNFLVIKKCRGEGILPFIIWPDDEEEIANERMLNLILSAYIAELSPLQIRQVVAYILEIKQPRERPNLIRRIFSKFWKVN